jgi:hypothetical protein
MGPTDSAPSPSATVSPLPAPAPPPAPGRAPDPSLPSSATPVTLVRAESPQPPPPDTLPLVTVSRTALLVGTTEIAPVFPGPLGFDGSIKRAGQRAALEVLPLKAALKALKEATPTEASVRVRVDASTSYRTALEVVFSGAQAGFTSFGFLVASAAGERTLTVSTPTRAERDAEHAGGTAPPIAFVLTAEGVAVSAGGVTLGPGCSKEGAGTTLPLRAGKPDVAGLASCVSRLRGMRPAWARSTIAEVSASPALDMQTVLEAVSVIAPSLPVIHFGMLST